MEKNGASQRQLNDNLSIIVREDKFTPYAEDDIVFLHNAVVQGKIRIVKAASLLVLVKKGNTAAF
ncbi:MAG: hypothetical protein JNL72_10405 [Flavipsychrobacter sp.]|nr:hypothetical protein [Flavipsychrobacter sp.]